MSAAAHAENEPDDPAQPVTEPQPTPPAGRTGLLALLGRHNVASVITTAVDFGVMTLAVELLHLTAVVATLVGATCGAVTNFQLGRHWIYKARHDHVGPQAVRYVLVSASSAGLNALGEYGLHDRLGVQYIVARAIVAVTVSLLWNFPMQRYFVFRSPSNPPGRRA